MMREEATDGALWQSIRVPRLVGRLRDAINAHDLDALVDIFDPDVHSDTPAHPQRTFRGADAGAPELGADLRRRARTCEARPRWRSSSTATRSGRSGTGAGRGGTARAHRMRGVTIRRSERAHGSFRSGSTWNPSRRAASRPDDAVRRIVAGDDSTRTPTGGVAMILVAGGTGTLGRYLIPLLLGRGEAVRVLSRTEPADAADSRDHGIRPRGRARSRVSR